MVGSSLIINGLMSWRVLPVRVVGLDQDLSFPTYISPALPGDGVDTVLYKLRVVTEQPKNLIKTGQYEAITEEVNFLINPKFGGNFERNIIPPQNERVSFDIPDSWPNFVGDITGSTSLTVSARGKYEYKPKISDKMIFSDEAPPTGI